MLVIRDAQLQTLSDAAERAFERRMVKRVQRDRPDFHERDGEEGVVRFVRAALDKATRYNIDFEEDIDALLDLMLAHGADFELEGPLSWARSFLEQRGVSGHGKLLVIHGILEADSKQ
ncbi:hypothetical protein JQX13_25730 [Archangium violaceum]|uniref:hypothetical protein n=1 Tax=Archangium violaceum TaxID=83451 RepID=UPI00193B3E38|nr:hypothetical protein [Archangium violaceum]QRK13126.1 hypothetical protein JQX13_25730 [Archangium violaceum]